MCEKSKNCLLFKNFIMEVPLIKENEITFQKDVLGREIFCNGITNRILKHLKNSQDGCSVSLHGDYGTGKTWFLKMWENFLNEKGYNVFYLDMWESEFYKDPLISFGHAVLHGFEDDSLKKCLNIILSYTKGTLKNLPKALLGSKGVQLKKDENVDYILDEYKALEDLKKNIKKEIKEKINWEKTKKPLFILVDELDRVQPPYALKALEAMKHFFLIPGVVFVFAVNKNQIQTSIRHHYGKDMDFEGYYRRFFNLQQEIPRINYGHFVEYVHGQAQSNGDSLGFPPENEKTRKELLVDLLRRLEFSLRDIMHLYEMFSHFLKIENDKWKWSYLDIVMLSCSLHLKEESTFNKMENTLEFINAQKSEDNPSRLGKIQDFIDELCLLFEGEGSSKNIAYVISTLLATIPEKKVSGAEKKKLMLANEFLKDYEGFMEKAMGSSEVDLQSGVLKICRHIRQGDPLPKH